MRFILLFYFLSICMTPVKAQSISSSEIYSKFTEKAIDSLLSKGELSLEEWLFFRDRPYRVVQDSFDFQSLAKLNNRIKVIKEEEKELINEIEFLFKNESHFFIKSLVDTLLLEGNINNKVLEFLVDNIDLTKPNENAIRGEPIAVYPVYRSFIKGNSEKIFNFILYSDYLCKPLKTENQKMLIKSIFKGKISTDINNMFNFSLRDKNSLKFTNLNLLINKK